MKKMTRKQKRVLIAYAIKVAVHGLAVVGAFLLYGSLGALEVERIQYGQFIIQCILGLSMIVFSRYANYKIYEEDNDYEYAC